MIVYKLTTQEKDLLVGQEYMPDNLFNPILDSDNNWIITNEEIEQCVNINFEWVKNLPEIIYKPILI